MLAKNHQLKEAKRLTMTDFRCPLPSQYEYVISISSFFESSCSFIHFWRRSSRILRSASSRSRSGRNDVSTPGFLVSLARLTGSGKKKGVKRRRIQAKWLTYYHHHRLIFSLMMSALQNHRRLLLHPWQTTVCSWPPSFSSSLLFHP